MKEATQKYYIDIEKVIRRIVCQPYYEDEMFATRRWLIENADYVVCGGVPTNKKMEGNGSQHGIKCHKTLSWDEVMDLMEKAIDEMARHGVQANKIRVAKKYELCATDGNGAKEGYVFRFLDIPLEFCELPERVNLIVEYDYSI